MTEPYPSTEVESKLKHLFRSLTRAHRAYKDTRNHALTLLHRASAAVLTAVLVYKALTYLLFLPAMNGIWSLTLRCSPVNYLTNNNAHQIFTSPTILGGIVLIVLLAACWNLYGFSILLHGFALARRGETLRPVSLFHCIITRETLLPLRAPRKYRSLFLIDISVPRNISPDVADIDEVYLYDIDTLTQLADEAKRSREQEVSRCEAIIQDNISKYFPDSALYDQ